MGKFCVKCGAPLNSGPFCVKCGADMRGVERPTPQSSQSTLQMPNTQPSPVPSPMPAKQGMSTLAKLGIAAVAIIFVGGAAGAVGVYYVAHKVSQKYHEVADEIRGSNLDPSSGDRKKVSSNSNGSPSGDRAIGDVCRLLSKEAVTKAIGVEIIRTEPTADSAMAGCSYVAEGTQQDMTSKHSAAMVASRGADQKTQQLVQTIAGGMFEALAQPKPSSGQGNPGEVPVFSFSVSQHNAEEMMRMSAKGFSNLGDTQGLPGIGDQAFVSGDGMIMVRKGKSLITIMFLLCPCGVEAVKPLAKEIADAL